MALIIVVVLIYIYTYNIYIYIYIYIVFTHLLYIYMSIYADNFVETQRNIPLLGSQVLPAHLRCPFHVARQWQVDGLDPFVVGVKQGGLRT